MCVSQQTYCFVTNNTNGQTATNCQLTGPGHGPLLDTLEHMQLLECFPKAGSKHRSSCMTPVNKSKLKKLMQKHQPERINLIKAIVLIQT